MKFSDLLIKNLKVKDRPYDVREGDGFVVRVMPSGKKTWCFIYTFKAKKKRLTLGGYPDMSLAAARAEHQEKRKLLAKGVDPAEEKKVLQKTKALAPTVADLIPEYIKNYAMENKKSWKEDQRTLTKDVLPAIGDVKVEDVTRRHVALILNTIKDRGAGRQANITLNVTRRMFRYAVSQGIIEFNPCLLIEKPCPETAKTRFLTEVEIKTFWVALDADRHMDPNMKRLLKLVLLTGQRPGELAGIHSDEIKGDWWTVPEERHKAGRGHRIFLSPLAKRILPQGNGHLLLMGQHLKQTDKRRMSKPCDKRSPSHAVNRFLKRTKLEIEPFTPHDLRRTAATHMGNMGIPPFVVSQVLGHADQSVTARQYNLSAYDAEKKEALIKWSVYLESLLQDKKQSGKVIQLFR